MGTVMLSHVDEFASTLHALERSLYDSLWAADECHDCTVGRLARINVQNLHATCLLNRSYDSSYYFHIAAFTEIRHAFDNSFHIYVEFLSIKFTTYKGRNFTAKTQTADCK
jgi:hypothetical protein